MLILRPRDVIANISVNSSMSEATRDLHICTYSKRSTQTSTLVKHFEPSVIHNRDSPWTLDGVDASYK